METEKVVLWVIMGFLLVAVVYVIFFRPLIIDNSVGSNGRIDTSGWTENEIMNYEMHGTIPPKYQKGVTANSQGTGMVGGC